MSFLDDDEDLDDIDDDEYVDAVKMERLRRAELQSRRMTVQQYMEFSGARGVSFAKGAKVTFCGLAKQQHTFNPC